MAKVTEFKRLVREDFPKDDQAFVDRLAFTINPALEAIAQAFNRNLTFEDNLNTQIRDIDLTVDASGIPLSITAYKSTLRTLTRGLICVRAENLNNPSAYATGQPFVSFSENNGLITLKHVSGLPANQKFRLKIISIG